MRGQTREPSHQATQRRPPSEAGQGSSVLSKEVMASWRPSEEDREQRVRTGHSTRGQRRGTHLGARGADEGWSERDKRDWAGKGCAGWREEGHKQVAGPGVLVEVERPPRGFCSELSKHSASKEPCRTQKERPPPGACAEESLAPLHAAVPCH